LLRLPQPNFYFKLGGSFKAAPFWDYRVILSRVARGRNKRVSLDRYLRFKAFSLFDDKFVALRPATRWCRRWIAGELVRALSLRRFHRTAHNPAAGDRHILWVLLLDTANHVAPKWVFSAV